MDGVRKYSKEWFTLNGGKEQANLAGLEKGARNKSPQQSKSLNESIFLGSKEDIQENYNKLVEANKGKRPSDALLNIQRYGLDNLIKALDADNDGEVTQDEINDVAAINTGELASKEDTSLTTADFDMLYQNALDAVNSSFEDHGLTKEFHYENGDVTKIELDNRGQLSTKTKTSHDADGNKNSVTYGYLSKSTTEVKYDSDGREINRKYDSPNDKQDYTITTDYGEDGSKTVTKDEYVSKTTSVYGADGNLQSKDVQYNYTSDGKIDATKQHSIGDCWLLSGVNALNQSPAGQKMLSDSIKHNDNGSVTVTLKGVGKEYTFTAEEIIDNQYQTPTKKYSSGDTDMNLFEKAIGEYRQELIASGDYKANGRDLSRTAGKNATVDDPLRGGQIDEAIYYITGLKSEFASVTQGNADKANDMLNTYSTNHDKYIMTVSFQNDAPSVTEGSIVDNHAYNIANVDDDYVYVTNPHDSSKQFAYAKKDFLENVSQIALTDLTQNKETETKTEVNNNKSETTNIFQKIANFFRNLF